MISAKTNAPVQEAAEAVSDVETPEERDGAPIPSRGWWGPSSFLPAFSPRSISSPPPALLKINDLFHSATGLEVVVSVRDAAGQYRETSLAASVRRPRFCELVRATPEGLARCTASHKEMVERVLRQPSLVCQQCHAGVVSVHFPAMVSGVGLADAHAVCALSRDRAYRDLDALYRRVADLGPKRAEVIESLKALRVLDDSDVKHVWQWLDVVVSCLSEASARVSAPQADVAAPARKSPADADAESVEERVRREIALLAVLPPKRGNRSCGCSEDLIGFVAGFLNRHFHLPLSTKTVAHALGFEPSYFGKMVKRCQGESFTQALRRVRLQHACELLRNPFLSVLEISDRAGFSDPSYFTRIFRQAFGVTPREYRGNGDAKESRLPGDERESPGRGDGADLESLRPESRRRDRRLLEKEMLRRVG